MSNPDKHITPWSASDIQKYLKGELSAREMHRLEKDALEDPFLADAIEGLSDRPPAELDNDLGELQSRLGNRVRKKTKQPIVWIKIAAAIVLLLGLGFTAWYTLVDQHSNKREPVAANAAPATATPSGPARTTDTTQTQTQTLSNAVAGQPAQPNAHPAIAKPDRTIPGYKTRSIRPTGPIGDVAKNAADVAKPIADDAKSSADTIDLLLKNKTAGLDITPSTSNLVYSGKVLDRNNHPLAGASLLVSGPSNAITTTNALGQFKLNLRPQDTAQQLTVALVGYQNASLAVNRLNADDAIANTIFLHEQPAALNEVVMAYGKERKTEAFAAAPSEDRNEKLDSVWIKIAPVGGRRAYLDYLQTGKKTLPVDSTIQGDETISFAVDSKGAPVDFKIEHSLSPAHDAGVLRLITEGVRWKTFHAKNIRALVRVSFP